MASGAERMHGKVVAGGPGVQGSGWWTWDPTLNADKPGGTAGEQYRPCNSGFQHGEIKPQNLWQ